MKRPWKPLKKLPEHLEYIKINKIHNFNSVNIYFQDESRFGLFTRLSKVITILGNKPICPYQHKFEYLYLYGSFSPIDGDSFYIEAPCTNSEVFEIYLNELSAHRPDELKIMVLDNAAFHKAKKLKFPDNIVPVFLPPYSPELNPAEKVWQWIKARISSKVFKTINLLSQELNTIIKALNCNIIKSIVGYDLYTSNFNGRF